VLAIVPQNLPDSCRRSVIILQVVLQEKPTSHLLPARQIKASEKENTTRWSKVWMRPLFRQENDLLSSKSAPAAGDPAAPYLLPTPTPQQITSTLPTLVVPVISSGLTDQFPDCHCFVGLPRAMSGVGDQLQSPASCQLPPLLPPLLPYDSVPNGQRATFHIYSNGQVNQGEVRLAYILTCYKGLKVED
jgi:hypothetical protein